MSYNITDITRERNTGGYYWAKYGDFSITMRNRSRYINGTHLCRIAATDSEEELNVVSENDAPKELMKIYNTYVHLEQQISDLITAWASRKLAAMVRKIIDTQI